MTQEEMDKLFEDTPSTPGTPPKPATMSQEEMDKLFESLPSSTPEQVVAKATPAPQSKPQSSATYDLSQEITGMPPEDAAPPVPLKQALKEGVQNLKTGVSDIATSTGNSIPFATRGFSAAQAAKDWMGGGGYDYAKRYQDNLDYLSGRAAQYPTYNVPVPFVGDVPVNMYDAMGVAGSSLLPMKLAGSIAKSGAPLLEKVVKGGLSGLGLGAIQGASNSSNLADFQQTGIDSLIGAGVGGTLGAVIPAAAGGAQKGVKKIMDTVRPSRLEGMGQEASDAALEAIAGGRGTLTPDVHTQLENLGPQGVIGDLNRDTQGTVSALAHQPGEHKELLDQTFAGRDPNATIQAALNDPVKGVPAWTKTQNDLHGDLSVEKSQFGQQFFAPLMQTAKDLSDTDVNPILNKINDKLNSNTLTDAEFKALHKIKDRLTQTPYEPEVPAKRIPNPDSRANTPAFTFTDRIPEKPAVPVTNPQGLHSVIMDIDQMAKYGYGNEIPPGAVSKTNGSLGEIRSDLSNLLKGPNGVPDYDTAMAKYESLYKQRDALNQAAEKDLTAGGGPASDFIKRYDAYSPEEKEAAKVGLINYIRNDFAKKANDVSATNTLLQGMDKTGNNYQKIAHVFGPEVPDNLINAYKAVDNIRAGNAAYQSGETAARDAAARRVTNTFEKMGNPNPLIDAETHNLSTHGMAASAGKGAINTFYDAFRKKQDPVAFGNQLTRIMTSGGQDAQNILADALRKAPIKEQNTQAGLRAQNILADALRRTTIPAAVYFSNRGK